MWPFSSQGAAQTPVPAEQTGHRDILADDGEQRAARRWNRMLVIVLRILALVCLVRGMVLWTQILGFVEGDTPFLGLGLRAQIELVVFAVLNCVCGVGLWLVSAWGAAIWLMMTLFEVIAPMARRGSLAMPDAKEIALLALAAAYIVLTWLAARERDRRG